MHKKLDWDDPRTEALVASLSVLLVLGVAKHVASAIPLVATYVLTFAAAFQLYAPIFRVGHHNVSFDSLGLRWTNWQADIRTFAIVATVVLIPYAAVVHLWQTEVSGRVFTLRWPPRFAELVMIEFVGVALPEELFFRGYLQERWGRVFKPCWRVWGVSVGNEIIVVSIVFALAHFIGEYSFLRLAPFFPSLIFGLLKAKGNSIAPAIAFHASCNLVAMVLAYSYHAA